MDSTREELLRTLVQHIMSVLRHLRHGGPPPEPALSPQQMHTLFSIRARKDCISVNELAKNTRVTPGAVTQFVNALVKKGLVSREIDPGDRRIVRLHLTELAKKQFEKFKEEQMSVMSRIFEVLSDEEIKQLIAIFTKLNTVHSARNHIDVETHKTPRTV